VDVRRRNGEREGGGRESEAVRTKEDEDARRRWAARDFGLL